MPKITPQKMSGNHRVSGDWCPGCGLYAHVNEGKHRDDCTRWRYVPGCPCDGCEDHRYNHTMTCMWGDVSQRPPSTTRPHHWHRQPPRAPT